MLWETRWADGPGRVVLLNARPEPPSNQAGTLPQRNSCRSIAGVMMCTERWRRAARDAGDDFGGARSNRLLGRNTV